MKKFTKDDVENVIDFFTSNQHSFSALDVKRELRDDHLYATQEEVAPVVHSVMDNYINDGYYERVDNGTYQEYHPVRNVNTGMPAVNSFKHNGTYNVTVWDDGNIDMQPLSVDTESKWVNPIGQTIKFVYDGGTYIGEEREVTILGMDETKLTGEVTNNDPAYNVLMNSGVESKIRNFSYNKMESVVYA